MRRWAGATAAMGCMAAVGASAQPYPEHVQKHLDSATMNAMGDEGLLNYIRRNQCFEVEDSTWRTWARSKDSIRVPLTQVFDDLWMIGTQYTASYFLKTADNGVMLIDALNNTADADNYLIPALRQLGLPLRGIYITHGHGDHDGGVNRLRQVFGNDWPVFLGSGDVPGKAYQPTPIDSSSDGVQQVTIGGTTLYVQATPGHTPGNQISLIPVHHNGTTIKLVMNWRSAVPASSANSKLYVQGLEKVWRMIDQYGAVGTIHTHAISDATLPAIEQIMATGDRTRTPLVFGLERTKRAAVVARECAIARAAQIDATAVWDIWRATQVKFVGQSPSPTQLAARVSSAWGPVTNQPVSFSTGSGATCTATTDGNGVATCTNLPSLAPREIVVARFAGSTADAGFVDLPGVAEATSSSLACDIDNNGKVDRFDLSRITAVLGSSVPAGDARDVNADGKVTVADARMCTVKCTNAQCAP